ncbi:hypothetical protein [Holdemanella biformis]|uniref:hypothetical protein n=1 Tax=Holdemanella biformis TaxID=1735 RepID=UPI00189B4331|nr:hypothetical protein [Holdemanella biformis]
MLPQRRFSTIYNHTKKNLILKKVKPLHSGHMVLGVWKQKDGLEKKWVLLDLRQNKWKKYNDV